MPLEGAGSLLPPPLLINRFLSMVTQCKVGSPLHFFRGYCCTRDNLAGLSVLKAMSAGCQNTSLPTHRHLWCLGAMHKGCPCATMPGTLARLRFASGHPPAAHQGPGSKGSTLTLPSARSRTSQESRALCYQFFSSFFFWLSFYLKKRKRSRERNRDESLLIHIHILTGPNVQLQQCLILPPVEKLLHSPFPFAFGK